MAEEMVPDGYKKTEVGVLPEDWEVTTLSQAVDFLDGKRRPIKDSERAKIQGTIPYYGASGIVDYVNDFIFDGEFILLGEDGENIVSRNSRLAFRVRGKFWVNNHAHVLRPRDAIDIGYLTEYLEGLNYEGFNSGTAQPKLNKQVCLRIPVALPPFVQQRAIATALSDIDALNAGLDQLIAKKRGLKQAAMQQLLTGQKRLPGFQGEWKTKKLGECLEAFPTYGINAAAVDYADSLPTYIRITDISEDGRFLPEKRASVDSARSGQYFLHEGDLVFARTGASVGKSYRYRLEDGQLVFAGFLIRVHPNPLFMSPVYLSEFVKTDSFWKWILVMSMRSGQPGVNGKELAQLPIPLPSIEEQSAIATILSEMDAELTALEQRRDKTRLLKQGMMQQLLTGRIRLVAPSQPPAPPNPHLESHRQRQATG